MNYVTTMIGPFAKSKTKLLQRVINAAGVTIGTVNNFQFSIFSITLHNNNNLYCKDNDDD